MLSSWRSVAYFLFIRFVVEKGEDTALSSREKSVGAGLIHFLSGFAFLSILFK